MNHSYEVSGFDSVSIIKRNRIQPEYGTKFPESRYYMEPMVEELLSKFFGTQKRIVTK